MTTTTAVSAPPPLIGHYVPEIRSLAKRGLQWAVLYGLFARGSAADASPPIPLGTPSATPPH